MNCESGMDIKTDTLHSCLYLIIGLNSYIAANQPQENQPTLIYLAVFLPSEKTSSNAKCSLNIFSFGI